MIYFIFWSNLSYSVISIAIATKWNIENVAFVRLFIFYFCSFEFILKKPITNLLKMSERWLRLKWAEFSWINQKEKKHF